MASFCNIYYIWHVCLNQKQDWLCKFGGKMLDTGINLPKFVAMSAALCEKHAMT